MLSSAEVLTEVLRGGDAEEAEFAELTLAKHAESLASKSSRAGCGAA